jgi:acylphosphatase
VTAARKIAISGVVQGVGFRWATRDEAVRAGLAGWVRNRPDGSVEAWVEGEAEVVARMVDWLREGPIASVVSEIVVEEAPPQGFTRFEIRD